MSVQLRYLGCYWNSCKNFTFFIGKGKASEAGVSTSSCSPPPRQNEDGGTPNQEKGCPSSEEIISLEDDDPEAVEEVCALTGKRKKRCTSHVW